MTQDTQSTNSHNFTISKSAEERIAFLASKEESDSAMLRVAVDGGGCSGFQYRFAFESTKNDDDLILEQGDAKVIIDEISIGFLENSELDFIDDLGGSFFSVKNPNASASCGCGNSFSV